MLTIILPKSEIATKAFAAVIRGNSLSRFLQEFKDYPTELLKYAEVKYNLNYKKHKNKPTHYTRVGILTPEETFKNMGKELELFGVTVNFESVRYRLYHKKGMKCVTCGIEGHYFAVEKAKAQLEARKYHLNLYHKTEQGKEIMMTVDHILPESKGGKRTVANLQTMCICCNMIKGNKIES